MNNLKNILIGVLSAVIVIAVGASVYNVYASPDTTTSAAIDTIAQYGNGNGNSGANGQAGQTGSNPAGSGTPQANITGVTTVHGAINSVDLTGISITTDDGQAFYVQIGNSRYNQSIGFAPAIGEGVTVVMFPGDQGLYSAISITVDSTGITYTFRNGTGQPLWSGGNNSGNDRGNGRGNGNRP